MTESRTTAQDILRSNILAGGHDDYTSLVFLQQYITRCQLAESVTDRQQLVVDTVRSLLVDGLVEIGDIPGRNDPGFKTWPGSVDEVMTQLIDRFVTHYDDRLGWEYTIWLNLTAEGKRVSNEIVLREKILESGHNAVVSMADVQHIIWSRDLADSVADRQQLTVDTVRSLLVEGLVEVGEIPSRNEPGFEPWPGTVDEVMKWFIDRFVGHYDDRTQWEHTIGLNLTADGKQASNNIVGDESES